MEHYTIIWEDQEQKEITRKEFKEINNEKAIKRVKLYWLNDEHCNTAFKIILKDHNNNILFEEMNPF